jgi:hypothetical protein
MALVALRSVRSFRTLVLPVDAVVMAFPVAVAFTFPVLMLGVLVMAVLPMIVLCMLVVLVLVSMLAVIMLAVLVSTLAIVTLCMVTIFSVIGQLRAGGAVVLVIGALRAMIVSVRVAPLPSVWAEVAAVHIPAVVRLRR